eukprot:2979517-Pyramimonas_sp.AAC.1
MAALRAVHCPNSFRLPVVGRRIRVLTATMACRVVILRSRCPPSARFAPFLVSVFHLLRALFAERRPVLPLEL